MIPQAKTRHQFEMVNPTNHPGNILISGRFYIYRTQMRIIYDTQILV